MTVGHAMKLLGPLGITGTLVLAVASQAAGGSDVCFTTAGIVIITALLGAMGLVVTALFAALMAAWKRDREMIDSLLPLGQQQANANEALAATTRTAIETTRTALKPGPRNSRRAGG